MVSPMKKAGEKKVEKKVSKDTRKESPWIWSTIPDSITHKLDIHPLAGNHVILSTSTGFSTSKNACIDVMGDSFKEARFIITTEDGTVLSINKYGRVQVKTGQVYISKAEQVQPVKDLIKRGEE